MMLHESKSYIHAILRAPRLLCTRDGMQTLCILYVVRRTPALGLVHLTSELAGSESEATKHQQEPKTSPALSQGH